MRGRVDAPWPAATREPASRTDRQAGPLRGLIRESLRLSGTCGPMQKHRDCLCAVFKLAAADPNTRLPALDVTRRHTGGICRLGHETLQA